MQTAGSRQTLILVGLTGIYAVCFALIRAGLAYAPPLLFAGLRALIGGAALLGLMVALRQPLLPPRAHWGGTLALALTATTLAFGAMFLSPGRTGAGIASVLGNTQPLIVALLATAFLSEPMTPGKWLTLVLGTAGVTLMAWQAWFGPDAEGISGAALALAASAGLLAITAWQLVLGGLPLVAASALTERGMPVAWSLAFVGQLLFLALVGTSLVNAAWYGLVQRGEVSRLTLYLFLVPVFGLGIAALALGERLSLWESMGSALIVAGIVAVTQPSTRHDRLAAGAT